LITIAALDGETLSAGTERAVRSFMTGAKSLGRFMQTTNIIERAFELARGSTSIEEIRKALRQEGYANVDAHLGGASIKADLKKQFVR
jgi:tRNA G26 N,N-dimethylase Trm1